MVTTGPSVTVAVVSGEGSSVASSEGVFSPAGVCVGFAVAFSVGFTVAVDTVVAVEGAFVGAVSSLSAHPTNIVTTSNKILKSTNKFFFIFLPPIFIAC